MLEIEREYASKGVAGTALGLSAGALGLELLRGGLGGILGGCGNGCNTDRFELSMQRELTNKDMEIAYLKSRDAAKTDSLELYRYIDGKIAHVERELADQRVYNATNTAALGCIQGQVAQLMSLVKVVIPNGSICPGFGDVTVSVTPASTT